MNHSAVRDGRWKFHTSLYSIFLVLQLTFLYNFLELYYQQKELDRKKQVI